MNSSIIIPNKKFHLSTRKCHQKSYYSDINFHMTLNVMLRATLHTRLGARDQHTPSTLTGRKGDEAGPSFASSHYTWGTNGVQDGCKLYMDSYMASNGSRFMVTWTLFKNHLFGGRPNMKPWDHDTPTVHNRWFILFLSCVRTCMHRNSLKQHLVEGPITYDFPLHLRVRDHTTTWCWRCRWDGGLWTLSLGLSQFHGHGSWLVCVKWPLV
jgi:hypothetical protein